MKIYPYMNGSKSAKALANELGIKILKREGVARKVDILINWGCSNFGREIKRQKTLNSPPSVAQASNKLSSFELFTPAKIPTVPWTTSQAEAEAWSNNGDTLVIREKLTGHSGEGIVILKPEDAHVGMPKAPLYTKYMKKKEEYRIHVFGDEVIFRQRKARKKEVPDEEVNWQVRNLKGGFIFAHKDLVVPDGVDAVAIAAVRALGLDFGAVDIGWHPDTGPLVYEVNTACGLEGENLQAYANAFRKYL